ncbi:Na+/H+ antiporter NhaC [Salipaludibacillus keqinensis]|uniref:Na+/H+ antiporter NhaC n=1 Tax=Salipaludibacillus keqinensis TaxID=2045207 RepID=A0A323TS19_9BACI|nr:Na+/H+ antiporter NhaC [Salipaludibacillus keqinensis]PYZ92195.1 Na+/H+ antiporter NhaC [Salipaludibacillus keqinensis]
MNSKSNEHIQSGAKRLGGWEALLVIASIVSIIGFSLIALEAEPHVPLFLSIVFLVLYNSIKRQSWIVLEKGLVKGVQSGIVPLIIFLLIGVLIAVWMKSGTIPTLISYSFHLVSVDYFLPSVFIVTAIIGISIGSSFTTASTIGIAFMSLGSALGFDLAMVAGAVVSGALLGDKMSPLSDTTNLASSVCKVDLFEHIRFMMWTAVPAFVISLILFFLIGHNHAEVTSSELNAWMNTLQETANVHFLAMIPAIIMVILAMRKVPAIPTMLTGIGVGFVVAILLEGQLIPQEWMVLIQHGFEIETGNENVDSLLNRGGIQSMMWAVSLLLLALSMGGMLSQLGIIHALISSIQSFVSTRGRSVLTAVLTAMGLNVSLGEQYMSVVLTGEAYIDRFKEIGLEGKHLSRALESGGTVVNALIPYGVSGVFMASVLEVSVLSYWPFAFFCLLCPVITVFYGFTGISMKK